MNNTDEQIKAYLFVIKVYQNCPFNPQKCFYFYCLDSIGSLRQKIGKEFQIHPRNFTLYLSVNSTHYLLKFSENKKSLYEVYPGNSQSYTFYINKTKEEVDLDSIPNNFFANNNEFISFIKNYWSQKIVRK